MTPRTNRGSDGTAFVVHPPRRLPMDADRQARAAAALTALLLPYLRRRQAGRLDKPPPVEPSSEGRNH